MNWRAAGYGLMMMVVCQPCRLGAADGSAGADVSKSAGDARRSDKREYVRRTDAAMDHWREDRFGVMIHWGVYAVPGGWWKGREVKSAAEWIKAAGGIPKAEYEALPAKFDPKGYDPVAWAKRIRAAGAKYVVITTKHHDGFCLWDSKFTDYDMGSTPYGRDVLRPLADAVRAEGMDMGFYYSIIDWHHPDFRAVLKTEEDKAAYARYIGYMKNQLRELLTGFGPVMTLWFDGRWDPAYKLNPQIGRDLEAYCRSLSPGLVLGDRVRAYDSVVDYDSGFERKLPARQPDTDWEACMTMTENSWGYHSTWSGVGWKTPATLCEMLSRSAAMSGNFLINIGPKADGTIRDEEAARLDAVGAWMRINGDAVHGAGAAGIQGLPDGIHATRKGTRVFLHVYRWPATDRLVVPGVNVRAAAMWTAGGKVPLKVEPEGVLTGLPMTPPGAIATVIELETAADH